jgi:hypothetical protein
MNKNSVIDIYENEKPDNMLIIGGEPMTMGIQYYLDILNAGVRFSMQSNFTLYTKEWNTVFTHPNFDGLSVSGDKMPESEFLEKLKLLRDTTILDPLVLIVALDYKMVRHWYNLSVKHNFAVKFNYLVPVGKMKDKKIDVKPYYELMTDLMDDWDPSHRIEPMYSLVHEDAVCPHINCVTKTPDIYSFEPDGEKFFCCVLSSLRIDKEQLPDGKMVSMSCLSCEHFNQCRGCVVRNHMVAHDHEYCTVMTAFFKKIKEKRDAK